MKAKQFLVPIELKQQIKSFLFHQLIRKIAAKFHINLSYMCQARLQWKSVDF